MREDEGRVIKVAGRRKELSGRRSGGGWAMGGGITVVRAVIGWAESVLRQE